MTPEDKDNKDSHPFIIAAIVTIVMLLLAIASAYAQAPAGDVITIRTYADLLNVHKNLNGHYLLVNDIDTVLPAGEYFPSIGSKDAPFTGKFYGQKDGEAKKIAVIRGIDIVDTSSAAGWAVGLFGVIGRGGEVKYVGVAADSVLGYYAVGVLAGINYGVVEACYTRGNVVGARRSGGAECNVGGLVGLNGGLISRSYSRANVGKVAENVVDKRTVNAGGLVGFLTQVSGVSRDSSGVISYCYYEVGMVSALRRAGGLVGYVFGGRVANCYSTGRVESGGSVPAGGLVGADFGDLIAWDVQGKNPAGYVGKVFVESSYWDSTVGPKTSAGGGEAKTTAEMRDQGTYVGWDFGPTKTWEIFPDTYPRLTGVTASAIIYDVKGGVGGGGRLLADGRASAHFRFEDIRPGEYGPLVAAEPSGGFRFVRWEEDGSKSVARRDVGTEKTVKFTAEFAAVPPPGSSVYVKITPLDGLDIMRKIGRDPLYPKDGVYEVTGGIDGKGAAFAPIDTFTGIFAGNGYKISDLQIKRGGGDVKTGDVGLFGFTDSALITGVILTGVTSEGKDNVGALVGRGVNTYIDGCGAIDPAGSLSVYGEGVGGLVGKCSSSVIIRSYSLSSASGADVGAGGLAGVIVESMVSHSYSNWNASAREAAGGLVGLSSNGTVRYSYSTGNAQGETGVGGLVGKAIGSAVYQCYSTGQVQPLSGADVSKSGGLIGIAENLSKATASYWNTATSGRPTSAGGSGATGKAAADMVKAATFAGWDFKPTGAWQISEGSSYPYLREAKPYDSLPGPLPKARASSSAKIKPFAHVKGKTMSVTAKPKASLQIRLIDMRGRTIARYNIKGNTRISLNKIPSGRYVVEARDRGVRVNATAVVVR